MGNYTRLLEGLRPPELDDATTWANFEKEHLELRDLFEDDARTAYNILRVMNAILEANEGPVEPIN